MDIALYEKSLNSQIMLMLCVWYILQKITLKNQLLKIVPRGQSSDNCFIENVKYYL